MFCFGFDSSYHAQLSNENLPYINLESILLTVQMSLPINYLPYYLELNRDIPKSLTSHLIQSLIVFCQTSSFNGFLASFWLKSHLQQSGFRTAQTSIAVKMFSPISLIFHFTIRGIGVWKKSFNGCVFSPNLGQIVRDLSLEVCNDFFKLFNLLILLPDYSLLLQEIINLLLQRLILCLDYFIAFKYLRARANAWNYWWLNSCR